MKFILSALVVLGSFSVYAQGHGGSTVGTPYAAAPMDLSSSNTIGFGSKMQAARTQFETGIDGTPFLFEKSEDDFEITATTKERFKLKNLNYDLKSQKMISQLSKDSIFEFDKNKVASFVKKNKKYNFIDLEGERTIFESLYASEDVVFYKKPESKIIAEKLNPMTKEVIKNRSYGIVENYYLGSTNASIVKIKLKKKDILKVLQNHSKEVEEYVDANKLDYDNESSVIKILKYYTSL